MTTALRGDGGPLADCEVGRAGGRVGAGVVRGLQRQSRRWRRQSMERLIVRKRKQEIRGVGNRQKDKGQLQRKTQQRLTRTARQRP